MSLRCPIIVPLLLLLVTGCPRSQPQTPAWEPIGSSHLHNTFRIGDRLFSGNSPEGDDAFRELQTIGIRTIISVDGAAPDARRAEQFGIRYVHLPIGYDGIPRAMQLRLAVAVQELEGPIYIHCHHGKHRGPAAVAAAMRLLSTRWTAETAEQWMKTAGTDPKYSGLYRDIQACAPYDAQEWETVDRKWLSQAPVADLTSRMVEIDHLWDRIKKWDREERKLAENRTETLTLLIEAFRECQRLTSVRAELPMLQLFVEAEKQVQAMIQDLRLPDPPLARHLQAIQNNCSQCHRAHRDRSQ